MNTFKKLLPLLAVALAACSNDDPVIEPIQTEPNGYQKGVYVLNEGNMGANKTTLDFLDTKSDKFFDDIYARTNPEQILGLGDAGNDLQIFNQCLYAVINGSNKVEIMSAATARSIGRVDVASPRAIAFDKRGQAYVSSFVGPVETQPRGSVVRFDVSTLEVTGRVTVGVGPEEMVVIGDSLYVANSYNYDTNTYDNTITIVDLISFTVVDSIAVAPNLHHLRLDSDGNLWVNSRGNYADIAPALYRLSPKREGWDVLKTNAECSNFAISGNKIYMYSQTWDADWNASYSYSTLDTKTLAVGPCFIVDPQAIETPYAIGVSPAGDIYITDARNYVSSGTLRRYNADGTLKQQYTTGDLPGHLAFWN
ncbi:MAG: YncE family protein [Muribaculaceae bacterium]|nr:YncE family protein [Muribaculaceae bacterium]